MRYWVHMNNEVKGPFEKEKLAGLEGFGPSSLIYPEGHPQGADWKAASAYPEVMSAISAGKSAPPPEAKPAERPQVDKLELTMRGSIIERQPFESGPAAGASDAPPPRVPEAPPAAQKKPDEVRPAVVPEGIRAAELSARLEPLKRDVEKFGSLLASLGEARNGLLARLSALEELCSGDRPGGK